MRLSLNAAVTSETSLIPIATKKCNAYSCPVGCYITPGPSREPCVLLILIVSTYNNRKGVNIVGVSKRFDSLRIGRVERRSEQLRLYCNEVELALLIVSSAFEQLSPSSVIVKCC